MRPRWSTPGPHPGDPVPPRQPDDLGFPDGFLWGCQTAATQVEGGNLDNNFIAWVKQDPRRVADGSVPLPGLDHWNRLEQDYRDLQSDGHNAHAFTIDWSRIEPVDGGPFDQAAMDHYRREIQICRARGMEPVITLLHYAIPNWLAAKGGILADEAPARFERFCRYVTEQVGDQVTWWSTVNEPNALAGMSYGLGKWPPGQSSVFAFLRAMGRILRIHAAGARAIRAAQKQRGARAMISIAHNLRPMHPRNRWNPLDWLAAKIPDYFINRWFLNSVRRGRSLWGLGGPILGFFGFERIEGLKESFDYVGLNYYTRNYMHVPIPLLEKRDPASTVAGFIEMTPVRNVAGDTYPTDNTYDPDGMYETAMNLWGQFHLPILITENGVSDLSHRAPDGTLVDDLRPRYIIDHAAVMHHLIARGVPIAGYLHWTDWDNWEWVEGWRPKFGLRSFDPVTGQREPKFGASIFRTLATRNAVPSAWLTAENRQSPWDRDRFAREAAEEAGMGGPDRGQRSVMPRATARAVPTADTVLRGRRAAERAVTGRRVPPADRDLGL